MRRTLAVVGGGHLKLNNFMEEILKRCKCGVYLTVNKHRDVYETAKQAIDEINDWGKTTGNSDHEKEIDDELSARMIEKDSIYELQFYPDTPIGFFRVYGTSLDEVVGKAKSCFSHENH